MKTTLFALAALTATGGALAQSSSVTLFGVVDASVAHVSTKDGSVTGLANGGNASSRLGFRGVEDLGNGLKASFWLEGGINVDDGGSGFKFDRRSTIGLLGNFGEVRLGRDKTPTYQNLETFHAFGDSGMGAINGHNLISSSAAGTIEPHIVVAPFCTEDRRPEYSPHHQGPDYAAWLLDELKPRVDATFRTRPGRDDTAVMGSSMGGLISLHIALTYPHLVAQAGCVSTHWVWEVAQFLRDLEATPPPHTGASPFLYFDFGTVGIDEPYAPLQARADAALARAGWRPGVDFITRRFEGAEHSEAAWRARLDSIVTHLFGPR